jgi:hypothetical protein
MIHNADQLISKGNKPDNIDVIKGRLSFIKMVMPDYAKKTYKKYPWLTHVQQLNKENNENFN